MDQYPFEREEKGILMALQPTPAFYERKDERHTGRDPFHFLWGYMKPYKRFFIQLLLGLALGSVLQLIFPFLTQVIVDKGIATKNLNLIYLILAGQLMLVLSRASVDFIRRWILLHISARVKYIIVIRFLDQTDAITHVVFRYEDDGRSLCNASMIMSVWNVS